MEASISKIEVGLPEILSTPSDKPLPRGQKKVFALDGLRAFAALSVILYHTRALGFPGGLFGVDIFFALSGFLLAGTLINEFRRSGTISVKNFYIRRVRRLVPAATALVVVHLVWRLIAGWDVIHTVRSSILGFLGLYNWAKVYRTKLSSDLFHLWSLSVEYQLCILIAPICFLILKRLKSTESIAIVMLLLVCLIEAERWFILGNYTKPNLRIYYGTDLRFATFALGAAMQAILKGGSYISKRLKALLTRFGGPLAIFAVVAHLLLARYQTLATWGEYSLAYYGVAVTSVALVVGISSAPESFLARFSTLPIFIFLGQISYGIYLWHYPLMRHLALPIEIRAPIVIVLSILFGTMSYYLIEKRFIKNASAITS